jgi:hypothetical protein
MIIRAMFFGFLLWLAVAAAFRFGGQYFFLPDEALRLITFVSGAAAGLVLGFIFLKLIGEAAGDEGEAAIGLALPVLLLNGYLTHEFTTAFPNLDATLDATYGAWSLLFGGSILFVGLLTTRIAPQDERV